MSKKLHFNKLILRTCACLFLFVLNVAHVHAQVLTYSASFTQGSTPTVTQANDWHAYRASLVVLPYFKLRLSGTVNNAFVECTNPVIVQDIALKLRTGVAGTWVDGTNTWNVGSCGSAGSPVQTGWELSVNSGNCACPNPGWVIRPAIGNSNWGGVNTGTCSPNNPSQTITVEFFYGFPCSGVPVSGISGVNQICPGKNFTLTLNPILTGITRQWQTSADGKTWTNFTGAVNSLTGDITDAIFTAAYYRCIITCTASKQTYTTSAHLVTISPFYYCYCEGSKATGTAGVDVGNVKVATYPAGAILLDSGSATPFLNNANAKNTYTDHRYNTPPVPMYHDSTYRLQVSHITSAATFTAATAVIYIDYNRNGRFDPWERVLLKTTSQAFPGPGIVADTFKMPDSAGYGLTGMRVILRSGTTAPDTCTAYADGETEDYLADIRYHPCNGKPLAGKIEGDTSMCTGYGYILTDTSYQKQAHGLSRQWQISADGIGWQDIPLSADKDTLSRIFAGQPLYYRIRMICSHTGDTAFTPAHLVNAKAAYKCYCFSQATGMETDSSDIGGFGIYDFNITDGGAHLGNPRAVRARQDYTDLKPIELMVDSMYEFHVYHTMPGSQHGDARVTVFMDFDNDHTYDIPGERVFTGFTNVGYHTIIKNIVVPNSAIADVPTGMRVILNNDVAPNTPSDDACGTYTSGETEDYMLIFRRPFNVTVNEVPGVRGVQLYPNPSADGKFSISFRSDVGIKNVRITVNTTTGQKLVEKVFSHGGGWFTQQIDLGTLAKGVYFVEVDADGIKDIKRLIMR